MNTFDNTTVPNFMDLCGSNVNPSFVQAQVGTLYNITFPGTPPYKLTSSRQTGSGNMSYCGKSLMYGLNTSSFAFSLTESDFSAGNVSPVDLVENRDGSYEARVPYNGSIVWIATEMKGNMSDKDAENTAYLSSNFSVDPMASEAEARRQNGASPIAAPWLNKGLALMMLASLVGGAISLV